MRTHGTRSCYAGGCRCGPCTDANAAMAREQRARHPERYKAYRLLYGERLRADPTHSVHGTVSGYQCGCRCDRCREASSTYQRSREEYYAE